jgi:hypothetical protein
VEDDHQPAKSPQEKKVLSYAKDRRNGYGDNAKASRKAIPRRKAIENRGNRRKVAQSLSEIERLDDAAAAVAESSARHDIDRVGGWKKEPDIPLAKHLERRWKRRIKGIAGQDAKPDKPEPAT